MNDENDEVTFLPPRLSSLTTADNDAPPHTHTNSSMKTSMLLSIISISLNDLFANDDEARMAIIGEVYESSNNMTSTTTAAAKEITKGFYTQIFQ